MGSIVQGLKQTAIGLLGGPTIHSVSRDPDFWRMTRHDRVKALGGIFPDYNDLNDDEKMEVVDTLEPPELEGEKKFKRETALPPAIPYKPPSYPRQRNPWIAAKVPELEEQRMARGPESIEEVPIVGGIHRMAKGLERVVAPVKEPGREWGGPEARAAGIADIGEGAFKAIEPAIMAIPAAGPGAAWGLAKGLAGFTAGEYVGRKGAEILGAEPGGPTERLAGLGAGVGAGTVAGAGREILGRVRGKRFVESPDVARAKVEAEEKLRAGTEAERRRAVETVRAIEGKEREVGVTGRPGITPAPVVALPGQEREKPEGVSRRGFLGRGGRGVAGAIVSKVAPGAEAAKTAEITPDAAKHLRRWAPASAELIVAMAKQERGGEPITKALINSVSENLFNENSDIFWVRSEEDVSKILSKYNISRVILEGVFKEQQDISIADQITEMQLGARWGVPEGTKPVPPQPQPIEPGKPVPPALPPPPPVPPALSGPDLGVSRREFLARTGKGAAGAVVSGKAPEPVKAPGMPDITPQATKHLLEGYGSGGTAEMIRIVAKTRSRGEPVTSALVDTIAGELFGERSIFGLNALSEGDIFDFTGIYNIPYELVERALGEQNFGLTKLGDWQHKSLSVVSPISKPPTTPAVQEPPSRIDAGTHILKPPPRPSDRPLPPDHYNRTRLMTDLKARGYDDEEIGHVVMEVEARAASAGEHPDEYLGKRIDQITVGRKGRREKLGGWEVLRQGEPGGPDPRDISEWLKGGIIQDQDTLMTVLSGEYPESIIISTDGIIHRGLKYGPTVAPKELKAHTDRLQKIVGGGGVELSVEGGTVRILVDSGRPESMGLVEEILQSSRPKSLVVLEMLGKEGLHISEGVREEFLGAFGARPNAGELNQLDLDSAQKISDLANRMNQIKRIDLGDPFLVYPDGRVVIGDDVGLKDTYTRHHNIMLAEAPKFGYPAFKRGLVDFQAAGGVRGRVTTGTDPTAILEVDYNARRVAFPNLIETILWLPEDQNVSVHVIDPVSGHEGGHRFDTVGTKMEVLGALENRYGAYLFTQASRRRRGLINPEGIGSTSGGIMITPKGEVVTGEDHNRICKSLGITEPEMAVRKGFVYITTDTPLYIPGVPSSENVTMFDALANPRSVSYIIEALNYVPTAKVNVYLIHPKAGLDATAPGNKMLNVTGTPAYVREILRNRFPGAGEGISQPKKGSIEFNPETGRAIVRILKNGDISTIVHELGHLFRRDLEDLDLAVVEDWVGVKGGVWTTAAEEKWGRGWERYHYDGKAPTPELASIFERFSQWMKAIYKRIKGSAIAEEIPGHIREIMDRLLTPKDREEIGIKEPGPTPGTEIVVSKEVAETIPQLEEPVPVPVPYWGGGAPEGISRRELLKRGGRTAAGVVAGKLMPGAEATAPKVAGAPISAKEWESTVVALEEASEWHQGSGVNADTAQIQMVEHALMAGDKVPKSVLEEYGEKFIEGIKKDVAHANEHRAAARAWMKALYDETKLLEATEEGDFSEDEAEDIVSFLEGSGYPKTPEGEQANKSWNAAGDLSRKLGIVNPNIEAIELPAPTPKIAPKVEAKQLGPTPLSRRELITGRREEAEPPTEVQKLLPAQAAPSAPPPVTTKPPAALPPSPTTPVLHPDIADKISRGVPLDTIMQMKPADQQRVMSQIADMIERESVELPNIPGLLKKYNLTPKELADYLRVSASSAGRTLGSFGWIGRKLLELKEFQDPEVRQILDQVATKPPVPWSWAWSMEKYQKVENVRLAAMVSQLKTAVRNAITQGANYGLMVVEDAIDGVFHIPAGQRMNALAQSVEDLMAIGRKFTPEGRDAVNQLLSRFPASAERLIQSPINDVVAGKVASALTIFNRTQEFFFRRMVFDAKVRGMLRLQGHHIEGMPDTWQLKPGTTAESVVKVVEKAVDESLRLTWAENPPRNSITGSILGLYKSFPLLRLIQPFPRFYFGNALKFMHQYSPLGFLSPSTWKGLASGDSRLITRAALGTTMLAFATSYRMQDDAPGHWYQINISKPDEEGKTTTLDVRAYAPLLLPYFLAAEIMLDTQRISQGLPSRLGFDDMVQFAGMNQLTGTGISLLDALTNTEKSMEFRWAEAKTFAGAYLASFLTPLQQIKDLLSAGVPQEAIWRDVRGTEFTGQMLKKTPILGQRLPEQPAMTRPGPSTAIAPAASQLTGMYLTSQTPVEREINRLGVKWKDTAPASTGQNHLDRVQKFMMGDHIENVVRPLIDSPGYQQLDEAAKLVAMTRALDRLRRRVHKSVMSEANIRPTRTIERYRGAPRTVPRQEE